VTRIVELIREHEVERVVVGMPLTLRGQVGEQARETQSFIDELASASGVEVVPFDERFTTNLAEQTASASSEEDARAAAHLLSSYLTWSTGAA
jgi:putative holliday junction resolvase